MATRACFTLELGSAYGPHEALRRVLDLRQHSRVIPLTTVSPAVAADELQAGTGFVARTAVGPFGFDDVMRVDELGLGGGEAAARISKHGRVIGGCIQVQALPVPGGSIVRWQQEVKLSWLPGFLQPAVARVLKLGYRSVLRRLLA